MDNNTLIPQSPSFFWGNQLWIFEIIISILVLILMNIVLKRGVKYLRRKFLSQTQDWKEKLDQIVYFPLHVFLWVLGVSFALDVIGQRFGFFKGLEHIEPFRNIALITCLTWIILRWKTEVQRHIVAKHHHGQITVDPGMVHVLGRLTTMIVLIIAALILLQILGLNIVPLLAFGGIGAAAIGLAGKDVIANFFGGLMLYLTRPFTIGDLIILKERNLEGHVEEIGWYLTSIRDKDKRPVYLPNAIFSQQLVINSSRMSHRRIEEKIGLRYRDFSKIKPIVEGIRKEILSHPSIDTNLPVHVFFNAFGQYSVDIYIDAYTLSTRQDEFFEVKQDILINIMRIIEGQDAEMPFPTTTIQGTIENMPIPQM